MGILKTVLYHYRTIINGYSSYTTSLPPHARSRLASWLVFEAIFRKPGVPSAGKEISTAARALLENQVALFAGYMVIFAHDDAVDKYNLQTPQIYDQLSRCLAAFLMGLLVEDGSPTVEKMVNIAEEWLQILQEELADSPQIVMELSHLLSFAVLLRGLDFDQKITVRDLLIKHGYEELCREWLNATIISAKGMGRAYRELSLLLQQYLGEEKNVQHKRYVFFMKNLVKCMYAQAHSPEQKSWEAISYERFIELAYLKSTILIDLYNYISDQVNERRFFATRYNSARACDQIIDDLKDYEEDTRDQVLGILHMHILEQGRLAEKFLRIPHEKDITIALVKQVIDDSQILRTTYDNAFLYQNPFIQAARDHVGNIRMEEEDAETILREIWVNAPEQLHWNIYDLARYRATLAANFKIAWISGDTTAILDLIHQSNFPLALLKSYSRLEYTKIGVILESHRQNGSQRAGYVGVYAVALTLIMFAAKLWLKRFFWRLGSAKRSHFRLQGVANGNE